MIGTVLLFGPGTCVTGRLWAEEASDFLPAAIGRDLGAATFMVFRGTLQIPTNWVVWGGARFALSHLPVVTFWASIAVLLVLGDLFGRWARASGIAPEWAGLGFFAFLMVQSVSEVVGTATNLQWLFSLCALLLLVMPEAALRQRIGWHALLIALAGLDGVPSCMLAPAFLLRARAERSRARLALGLILSVTSIVQIGLLLSSPLQGRSFAFNPGLFLVSLALHLAHPFTPAPLVHRIGVAFLDGDSRIAIVLAAEAALAAVLAGLARLARAGPHDKAPIRLILLAMLVTMANLFGAIGEQGRMVLPPLHGRYFVFIFFTAMLLLVAATRRPPRRDRTIAMLILALAATIGVIRQGRAVLGGLPQPPPWAGQIESCRGRPDQVCRLQALPIENDGSFWPASLPAGAVARTAPGERRLP